MWKKKTVPKNRSSYVICVTSPLPTKETDGCWQYFFSAENFSKKKKLKRVINLHNASVNPFFFAKASALTSLLTKPSPCSLIWRYKTPVDVSRMARENRRQIYTKSYEK